ncbi:hypothetical protein GF373_07350 [bacterium]|mgnify:CR=1 FL=1|nr:hypothetical protein [bacterium]
MAENTQQTQNQETNEIDQTQPEQQEHYIEEFGWEFHKKPLFFAAIVTGMLYLFVFFYVNRW